MLGPTQNNHLWSIILSGGEGERLRPYVQRVLGQDKPKQYCAFTGKRSMFQHTVDRADLLVPAERRVIVIAQSHRAEVPAQLAGRVPGEVIPQPENRDTAAGIFLPLAHVLARDPHALVLIYPSDHFIHPVDRFLHAVRAAAGAAELMSRRVILVAVPPDRPEPDYGWLRPGLGLGEIGGHALHAIATFVEKPNSTQAEALMRRGGLWNTFILAAQAAALWDLGRQALPEVMARFEDYRRLIGTPLEEAARACLYERLPERNFSSAVLARFPDKVCALQMPGVLWSDWGRAERILETLRQIGKPVPLPLAPAASESDNGRSLSVAV